MKLLLISNSRLPGQAYLEYPKPNISAFLGETKTNIVFIPYAAVTFSYDDYETKVNEALADIDVQVTSIHRFANPIEAIENAEAIVVGGGNTWQLVKVLHEKELMTPMREKVKCGTPFIGWSAGSNIACPTLRTTNDMPIVEPKKFETLTLVPFQINPHYLDEHPENHAGETREQRIGEFIEINRNVPVVGLREGTMLWVENGKMTLHGHLTARIFKYGQAPVELSTSDDCSFLLG